MYRPEGYHSIHSNQLPPLGKSESVEFKSMASNEAGGSFRERFEAARLALCEDTVRAFETMIIRRTRELPHLAVIPVSYHEVLPIGKDLPARMTDESTNYVIDYFTREGFETKLEESRSLTFSFRLPVSEDTKKPPSAC